MSNKEVNELESKVSRLEKLLEKTEEKIKENETKAADSVALGYLKTGSRSDSTEQKAAAYFGVSHPSKLLEVNTADEKYKYVPNEVKNAVRALKQQMDISRCVAQIEAREFKSDSLPNILHTNYGKNVLAPMVKAFGSTVVGGGDEWVPTAMASNFIEEFELEKRVAGSFREYPMTSNPYDLPIQTSKTTARIVSENTAQTDANFSTGKITFSAKKLGEYFILPEELTADSAVSIMPIARQEVLEAQVRAREAMIVNGDDSVSHMDSDVTDAADARKVAKGLRKLALDNSANGSVITFGSAVTAAKLDDMLAAAGKYGINPRALAFVVSPLGYRQMVKLDEVSTVEKFGAQATILSGALAAFRAVPILITEQVRDDLNAAGVYDGVTTDNTCIHLVNSSRFWVGMRRPIQVRVQQDLVDQDRMLLASYSRIDFKGLPQDADEVSTILGVDVTA
jgi:HK97 family phage major capsid protein